MHHTILSYCIKPLSLSLSLSLSTPLDINAQVIILRGLRQCYPKINIVAEEEEEEEEEKEGGVEGMEVRDIERIQRRGTQL